jgi:hypothetical protein
VWDPASRNISFTAGDVNGLADGDDDLDGTTLYSCAVSCKQAERNDELMILLSSNNTYRQPSLALEQVSDTGTERPVSRSPI